MSSFSRVVLGLLAAIILASGETSATVQTGGDADIDTLGMWLTGTFTSERHAAMDSGYYHVILNMQRMWKDRTDGVWIIVEQYTASCG